MSYVIGNTTVIDNNGALGAVSGNSLNLANNSNIDAGGGGVKSLTSSSNFPDSDLGSTGAIAVCVGGGGGAAGTNNQGVYSGGSGGTVIHAFALGAGNAITATVGAKGNNTPFTPNNGRAPSGGTSSISYPNTVTHGGGGGNGGRRSNSSSVVGGPGNGLGGVNYEQQVGFGNTHGKGSNLNISAGNGYVGILGL